MKIDLGFMKIPLSGDYSNLALLLGQTIAAAIITAVTIATPTVGPALKATDLVEALSQTALVTCGWCILYYNFIGCAVVAGLAAPTIYEMFTPGVDVGPSYAQVASRFAGNLAEQAPIFLMSLWMYTFFADSATGGALGALYLVSRVLYPVYYMVLGKFTFWFESCTQTGYGINGVFLLGTIVTLTGGDWLAWSAVSRGVYGFLFGSFALLPGIPFTPIISYAHYKCHTMLHWDAAKSTTLR